MERKVGRVASFRTSLQIQKQKLMAQAQVDTQVDTGRYTGRYR